MSKLYGVNPEKLGELQDQGYYDKHVLAMTTENLLGKMYIASELASRDQQIDQLLSEIDRHLDHINRLESKND